MSWKNWFSDPGATCAPPPQMPSLIPQKPVVIVLEKGRLNEAEIAEALQGNLGALWYQAIVSKIEQVREDNLLEASRAASAGNAMAMAGGLNAYEAFTALLNDLDGYVRKTDEG